MSQNKLLPPQIEHAKTLLDGLYMTGCAFDPSDTGTGKTYTASAIAKEMAGPIVVICPKIIIPKWKTILPSFGVNNAIVINYEKVARGNTEWLSYKKNFVKKKNWKSVGITIKFPKNALVILDEVHKCRGFNSLHSALLIALKNQGYKILSMSASAATTVIEMKALGFALNLHNGENFNQFCADAGAEKDGFGGYKIDMSLPESQQGMQRIHYNLFHGQRIASRMTVDMFDGIFPENHILAECFDVGDAGPKIERVYEQMQHELDLLEKRAEKYKEHVFAIIMKARRHAELLKVPAMVEMVEDLYDEGISPVVFLNFQDSMEAIENRLKKMAKFNNKIALIKGGQKDEQRQRHLADFNDDKGTRRIMLANMKAGSAAIDMHDLHGKFPRHSIINPCFSAVDILQALGRIARQGGKTRCLQKLFFAAVEVEEKMCERVQMRLDNLSLLNDDDLTAGINFFRD